MACPALEVAERAMLFAHPTLPIRTARGRLSDSPSRLRSPVLMRSGATPRPTNVAIQHHDGIASIELTRADRANSLGPEMFAELARAFDEVAGWSDVRVIILSGRGRHFSAGGDLDHPLFSTSDRQARRNLVVQAYEVTSRILDSEAPVVNALHGRVAGAALAMALACDLRVAAESTIFSLDFVRLGLAPDMGVSFLLGSAIGTGRALEFALTGDLLDAPTALEWGLVSRVVSDGQEIATAQSIAQQIAQHPPAGLRETRQLVRRGPHLERSVAFENEIDVLTDLALSDDTQARLHAFRNRVRERP